MPIHPSSGERNRVLLRAPHRDFHTSFLHRQFAFTAKMPLSTLTNALGPSASALVLWKDVKQSGAFVALVSCFWLVVSVLAFTPSQLITLSIAILTPLSFGWSFAAQLLKREGPHVPDFLTHGLKDAEISKHASSLTAAINPTLGEYLPLFARYNHPHNI